MARIELRNAIIRILDGFSATADVNNGAGYAANAVTMTINNASTTIPVLASFTVVGSDKIHIVTSTNGSTTITFSPGLTGAVVDGADIIFGGRAVEVKVGDGSLTYNETREMNYELDRGNLDTVREGDQQPVEVNLDFIWDFITAVTASGTPTIEDAFKNRGEASTWVSSSADACEPYAVDIQVEYIPPCGGEEHEIITLPDFRYESLDHNITDAQVSVTGKCNAVEAVVTRPALS